MIDYFLQVRKRGRHRGTLLCHKGSYGSLEGKLNDVETFSSFFESLNDFQKL